MNRFGQLARLSKLCTSNSRQLQTSSIISAKKSKKKLKLSAFDLEKLETLRKNQPETHPSVSNELKKMSEKAKEQAVPTSRTGRVMTFAPMVLKIAGDVAGQYMKKGETFAVTEETIRRKPKLNPETTDVIVKTFTKARGAALKIGQFISMQDENVVPAYITKIFDRVRDSADFMPFSQVEQVLKKEFGENWESKFKEFEHKPFAAASIGQVHRAVTLDDKEVAVKVQYPGIADSIDSDFSNLMMVLPILRLPESFYVDESVTTLKKELHQECDYHREADCTTKMRGFFEEDIVFDVPNVETSVSSKRILATHLIRGGLTIDECAKLPQETRNFITRHMIRLAFYQLFTLRFMQTDPNFANYFWDDANKKIWLIDFGATQEYSKEFMDVYIEIIDGAVRNDRNRVLEKSRECGFLTGFEGKEMEHAHVDSVMLIGEFIRAEGDYDFTQQRTTQIIAEDHGPKMAMNRLKAPPKETYSINRALAGVFIMATKLEASVHSLDLWNECYDEYKSRIGETE